MRVGRGGGAVRTGGLAAAFELRQPNKEETPFVIGPFCGSDAAFAEIGAR